MVNTCPPRTWNGQNRSLFTLNFHPIYSINSISWAVFVALIFFKNFGSARTVFTLFSVFVNVDFFLATAAWKIEREGGVAFLVTFTSGASTGFSFDLHTAYVFFSNSFVPVRRREEAERNLCLMLISQEPTHGVLN